MSTSPVFLTDELARELRQLLLERKRNPAAPETLNHRRGYIPPRRGILLQDLPTAGQADCQVLAPCTTTMVQKISLIGEPTGGKFTLSLQLPQVQGQPAPKKYTTDPIKWNASASDVQTALQKLPNIGPNNVNVTLGKIPAVPAVPAQGSTPATPAKAAEFPGVWLVEFVGPFENPNPPAPTTTTIPLLTVTPSLVGTAIITVQNEQWRDSGITMTASAVIPVGLTTPQKAGNVVLCHMFPGVGYVVGSCECREFAPGAF